FQMTSPASCDKRHACRGEDHILIPVCLRERAGNGHRRGNRPKSLRYQEPQISKATLESRGKLRAEGVSKSLQACESLRLPTEGYIMAFRFCGRCTCVS